MSYEKVAKATSLKIGTKQTVKAIEKNQAVEVIIASDANPAIIKLVTDLAREKSIIVSYVDSMKKLGETCGIDVKAATVAIISK